MNVTFNAEIKKKSDGLTLFDYLDGYFPFLLAVDWRQKLLSGSVKVGGELIGNNLEVANPMLHMGEVLEFTVIDYEEESVNEAWKILWQNDALIAVHKPENLPVHRTTRNVYNTLSALVRRESGWPEAQLLHRLDQETSGIVMFAKTKQQALFWQPQLNKLLMQKKYLAVVYGNPTWQTFELTKDLATRPSSAIRSKMYVCESGEKGKTSTTLFKVLERFESYSIVECELVTGRKHQIRAHLSFLGHPIVGDKIYSNEGEYYLKRLIKAVTSTDNAQLITQHHLLIAQYVRLNLNLDDGDTLDFVGAEYIDIVDPHFPSQWKSFIGSLT